MAVAATRTPAAAQSFDSLACFKIKDGQSTSATANLQTEDSVFDVPDGCTVSKAKLFCAPTASDVAALEVDGEPAIPLAISGTTPTDARVCYKVKCPDTTIAGQTVTDKLGSRTISKFKVTMLCTPAIAGAAPTTTTSSTTTTTLTTTTTSTTTTTTSTTSTTLMGSCTTLFSEDFSTNSQGWTLDTEWQIGPTVAGFGHAIGNPDPATDHSASADNSVAGVVIGGSYATVVHGFYYLSSPTFDTSASSTVSAVFWRWLNSDYAPYVANTVQVWNGSSWTVIWTGPGSPGITDSAWTQQTFDLTPFRGPSTRIRFGFSVTQPMSFAASGWNVDDVVVTGCP